MKGDKYKWDGDTRDERESEFTESTSFSTTRSGYNSTLAYERARRKRRARVNRVVWFVLVAATLSSVVLYAVAQRLRG